jgi:hypothetical protein
MTMRIGPRRTIFAMTLVATIIMPVPAASAAEYYFTLIFGSQSSPKRFKYTHTWATFVRAVGEGPDLRSYALEQHTISWLPRTLNVRVWAARPEPGVNLDLYQTLHEVYAQGESVTLWGPFMFTAERYQRSLRVRQILESGAAQYRAIDNSLDLEITDCIHAVAATDPIFGLNHYPLIRIGKPASRYISREVIIRSFENKGIDQARFDNSWLISRLGLDRYPIEVIPATRIPPRRCLLCRIPE